MVGRRGLVVTESVVTRRLGRVEGISMNLETVRFPGENLLHREELEGGGVSVQGLRQCSLLHFVFFKPLRYTCRRSHRVLERRLVQPRDSVSHLGITQVQQRGPGRSLCLSRVDFVRSLWCSHSLSEDLILRCRDLLTVTLIFLVIRNGSLGIRVHRYSEVDWRLISCRRLHWRGSREWGTWSGFPGLVVALGLSHGNPGLSHGSPGLSLGRPGPSDKRTDGNLWSMEKPLWRLGSSLWSSSRRGWSPLGWVMSGSRHWWLDSRTGRGLWNTRLVHPTL